MSYTCTCTFQDADRVQKKVTTAKVNDCNGTSPTENETTEADVRQNLSDETDQLDMEEDSTECSSSDKRDEKPDSSGETAQECDKTKPITHPSERATCNYETESEELRVQHSKLQTRKRSSNSQALNRAVHYDSSTGAKRLCTYNIMSSSEIAQTCKKTKRVNPSERAGFKTTCTTKKLQKSSSARVQSGKGSSTSQRAVKSGGSKGRKRLFTHMSGGEIMKKIKCDDEHVGVSEIKEKILRFRGFAMRIPPALQLEVQPDCLVDVDTDAVSGMCVCYM